LITEHNADGYDVSFSGDCNAQGRLNLALGEAKICIITNNDSAPTPPTPPSSGGSTIITPSIPPLIDVVKVPDPLSLPFGPGFVTYTYSVSNIGTVPVTNLSLVGDTCSPINLVSGDLNNDGRLDVNEVWVHRCYTTLLKTHTNTVVATGWANGLSTTDIASATVVVGAPVIAPLIHVTKIPSPLSLSAGGGNVTYTEKITNPGKVALSNITIKDDKCSPLNYLNGDTNLNYKLDIDESWTYVCYSKLTKTTTNTVVASGESDGRVVRDFAVATVVVAPVGEVPNVKVPGLPNTGIAPETNNSWIVFAFLGLLALATVSLVIVFSAKKSLKDKSN
jgi:hypothetical protein